MSTPATVISKRGQIVASRKKGGKARSGTGSCKEQPDGRWLARLPADELGKRPKKYFATEREGLAWIKTQLAKRDQGIDLSTRPTIAGFGETWLELEVKPELKPKTYEGYAYILRHFIYPQKSKYPSIGELRLDQMTWARAQQLKKAFQEAGLAPWTVRTIWMRLRQLLDAAVTYNHISTNPMRGDTKKLPKLGPSTKCALSAVQSAELLDAAEGYQNSTIYHLLLGLGLRRGEALGLRWADLDWEQRTISITQQVQEIDGKVVITPSLKTDSSRRTLPLTDDQIARLREQWDALQKLRRAQDADWKEHGLIFPSEKGTPWGPSNLYRQFGSVKKRAGIARCALHELRHTFATLLGDLEVQEWVIKSMMGHSAGDVTREYTKVRLARMRAALDLLEPLLRRAA